jgi:hypothetical protein
MQSFILNADLLDDAWQRAFKKSDKEMGRWNRQELVLYKGDLIRHKHTKALYKVIGTKDNFKYYRASQYRTKPFTLPFLKELGGVDIIASSDNWEIIIKCNILF